MNKGFVDLQVNGYLGVDFSARGLTVEKIHSVTQKLVEQGVVAYCPTVGSCPMEIYEENLPMLAKAMEDPELGAHILGIHLEGPFISPMEGARGAHEKDFVRLPDIEEYQKFQELSSGRIVLVTLAPELQSAESLIRHITGNGNVTVSLGHHMASKAQIEMAVRAGASACTHLGNGIPDRLPRHPNPIWTQLDQDPLTGMFITDGHHIPPEFIRVALKIKTPEWFIVTSDVSSIGGMPPGTYDKHGKKVVIEESGRISIVGSNYLAGSSSNMTQCMNILASVAKLSEDELWKIGFSNPLRLINKDLAVSTRSKVEFSNGKFTLQN